MIATLKSGKQMFYKRTNALKHTETNNFLSEGRFEDLFNYSFEICSFIRNWKKRRTRVFHLKIKKIERLNSFTNILNGNLNLVFREGMKLFRVQ